MRQSRRPSTRSSPRCARRNPKPGSTACWSRRCVSDGLEILVGTVRDPQWGLTLAVGLGGVWVEALADTQLRLLPVTPVEAREMLIGLRAARLLQGFRGTPAADLDRLAEVIAAIGDAALALGERLTTLEVNPLWVRGAEIEALDGLAVYADE